MKLKTRNKKRFICQDFLRKNSDGFTLIESLVAIFVFTLTMGAISGLIVMLYKTHSYSWQQSVAISEARRGVETMVREIREARTGEDGSYPIEYAGDKEFVFYSDINKDGLAERVRYFLGSVNSGDLTDDCITFDNGGSCGVSFSNFLTGTLKSAQVRVSVEGDFGRSNEYADIYADGTYLGRVCESGCTDCAGSWEGDTVFDVTNLAQDNSIQFTADASSRVNNFCDWQGTNHSMKAKFELSWTEEIAGSEGLLKKGVIEPTGNPATYPSDQEKITILSSYVRNSPPIFKYFDTQGNELTTLPVRLKDTKLMEIYLVVNVDPNRSPQNFGLRSFVQLRNLRN